MALWPTLSKSPRRSFISLLTPLIYLFWVTTAGSRIVIKVKRLLSWRVVSAAKEPESTAGEEKGQTSQAHTSNPQQSPKVRLKTAEKKRKHESADEHASCHNFKRTKNWVQGESAEGHQAQKCCPDKASWSWGQWASTGQRLTIPPPRWLCPLPDIKHRKGKQRAELCESGRKLSCSC